MRICAMLLLSGLFCAGNSFAGRADNSVVVCDDVADPGTLDPHYSFDNKTDNILKQIYEGLVKLDEHGRLKPCLARAWHWEEDTIVFELMPGVKFHNGEPFDARSVAFSLTRLKQVRSGTMQLGEIGLITVLGPDKVAVRVEKSKGMFLHNLAAFAKMVPPVYFSEHDEPYLREHPVGTGPFKFSEWKKGSAIVLKANDDYWKKGLPRVSGLVFRFVPSSGQIDLLLKGEIDMLAELPGTQTTRIAARKELKVVKTENFLSPVFWFLNFSGPLGDAGARQALNYAVNKDHLIRYAALGNGKVLASLSMPGEVGHSEVVRPYDYDPGKARMLLAGSGWRNDYVLKMLVVRQAEREARIIAENLKQAGVSSSMTVVSMGELMEDYIKGGRIKEFDLCANLAPDPVGNSTFLAGVCFYGKSPAAGLRSGEFDALYEKALEVKEMEGQDEIGKELDVLIHDRALALFTYQRIKTYGINAGLVFVPSITGMLDFRDAYWRKRR